jgi:hypothetical protein
MRYLLFSALLALFWTASLEADIINVPPGADLQSKLDLARPGDEIVLEAGATYVGPITLGAKEGAGEIVIRSSALSQMPAGVRITPAAAALMPKIVSSADYVVRFTAGAHDYRLAGLEIAPVTGRFLNELVRIGSGQESAISQQPTNITIDRSYIHGDPQSGSRRGVALNGVNNFVIDSHIADFKATDVDSQAIAGWNGAGPFLIRNNYLEAAAENIMFGGADPVIQGLVPSNIRIEGNHLRKPTSWKDSGWLVKNLFQLKNARQVVIDGNILEDCWMDGQAGHAVVITPVNQDGGSPWSTVEDVQFTNNIVRRAPHGVLIANPTRRLTIRNNRFEEIAGALFEIINKTSDVVIEHNTGAQGRMAVSASGEASNGFVFRNNLTVRDEGGILGFPAALSRYFPGAIVEGNAFIGGDPAYYPANNFFPATVEAAAGYGQVLSPVAGTSAVPRQIGEVERPGIRVGYVVVTPDAGTAAPLASALVGRVQNGEVLSQTTVFPVELATSAAMFVDVTPSIRRNMGLAISNPNPQPISVTLELIDSSGSAPSSKKVLTLEPHAQIARFIDEFFGGMPSPAFVGTLSIESTAPVALMGFRFGGVNFSVISINNTSRASAMPLRGSAIGGPAASMFPQFAMGDGWATQLMLLNRAASGISGRIDVFDSSGNPMPVSFNGVINSTFRYSIPAGGTLLLAPRDANGQSAL